MQNAENIEKNRGRVVSQEKGAYQVHCHGSILPGQVSGAFRYKATTPSDFPGVGDYVVYQLDEQGTLAIIDEVLPRKSAFIRKGAGTNRQEQVVATNIDNVLICMSLNNDFNLRRLERYVSISWDSNAIPVVVLTKADLCENLEEMVCQVAEVAMGVEIIVVSSHGEKGYEQLMPYIKPGKTVAILGSSGVGKSTIVNYLMGQELIPTNGLRNDDKGRHTTTHRELIYLQNGAMVIDTPGMRELGMWDADGGLEKTFEDIEELTCQCRFSNCTHNGEPGCAVRRKIQEGNLSPERWANYLKLKAENQYAKDSQGYIASKEEKFKEIAKINRNNKKR